MSKDLKDGSGGVPDIKAEINKAIQEKDGEKLIQLINDKSLVINTQDYIQGIRDQRERYYNSFCNVKKERDVFIRALMQIWDQVKVILLTKRQEGLSQPKAKALAIILDKVGIKGFDAKSISNLSGIVKGASSNLKESLKVLEKEPETLVDALDLLFELNVIKRSEIPENLHPRLNKILSLKSEK
jgi:hypothetical protein